VKTPAELILLREALEGHFSAHQASALLYRAMDEHGSIPEGIDEVLAFCGGALSQVIEDRHGAEARDAVTRYLSTVLGEIPAPKEAPELEAWDQVTEEQARHGGAVPVIFLSENLQRGQMLEVALGTERARLLRAGELAALRPPTLDVFRPMLVLIDAAEPVADATRTAAALDALPTDVDVVVFASDERFGRELVGALSRQVIGLPREEGIEPMCDLVLTRHQPPVP